jgi:hypothetical protein
MDKQMGRSRVFRHLVRPLVYGSKSGLIPKETCFSPEGSRLQHSHFVSTQSLHVIIILDIFSKSSPQTHLQVFRVTQGRSSTACRPGCSSISLASHNQRTARKEKKSFASHHPSYRDQHGPAIKARNSANPSNQILTF